MHVLRGTGLGATVLATVLGVATFASTASNTVPATEAGEGEGMITGYVASSVHYALNGSNPADIDNLTFNLDSTPVAGSTLKAQIDSVGGTWYTCTNAATAVTCDTQAGTQATVAASDSLRVVVAG